MKRLALVAAVLVLAACTSKKDEAATADTSARNGSGPGCDGYRHEDGHDR